MNPSMQKTNYFIYEDLSDNDHSFPELSRGKLRGVLSLLGEEPPRHLPLLQVGLPVQVLRVDVAETVLVRGVKHL